ncbi:MAG: hypothetical protein E7255_11085 [Lachnospiraceae bacterium]|nr:hypothetical protein [Lachnospiraceae bacterium]
MEVLFYVKEKQGEKAIPLGFYFPVLQSSRGASSLVTDYGFMPETKAEIIPEAYMIQDPWTKLLRSSLNHPKGRNWLAYPQLRVIEMEQALR